MKKRFMEYPFGYFHIHVAGVHTEEGRLQLFVAINHARKFVCAELHDKKTKTIAAGLLRGQSAAFPYKIHTILTDNGLPFTNRK